VALYICVCDATLSILASLEYLKPELSEQVRRSRPEQLISDRPVLLQDVRHCGYPDRLLLPKGKRDGLPFSLFVMLTDFDKEKVSLWVRGPLHPTKGTSCRADVVHLKITC
jgi:hypothetical protein